MMVRFTWCGECDAYNYQDLIVIIKGIRVVYGECRYCHHENYLCEIYVGE